MMACKWLLGAIGIGACSATIYMIRRYLVGRTCPSKALLSGKTVVVTGANSGIGKATVAELARRHARVILACRNVKSGHLAVEDIRRTTKSGTLIVKELNLSSLKSVRNFSENICKEEKNVDILINNAGVYTKKYSKTDDGFESQMGVNHFGHFLLTHCLIEKLKSSSPSRIIVVSSALHKRGKIHFDDINSEKDFDVSKGYVNSKLANVLFARELSRRQDGSGITVHTVHPGLVLTNLFRDVISPLIIKLISPLLWLVTKTSEEGCQTIIYCAVAKELENVSGRYYGNCEEHSPGDAAMDDAVAKKLWEVSERLTGI